VYDSIGDDGDAHALWLCADHFRIMCGGAMPARNSNKTLIDTCMY